MGYTKLDFFIIGAQKAGSSWLAEQLRRHPGVYIPSQEVHYFDHDRNFAKGPDWYGQFFEGARAEHIVGEKTPSMFVEDAQGRIRPTPQRLYDHNPDLKLLAVLRDPIRRAESALCHHIWKNRLSPRTPVRELLFGQGRSIAEKLGIVEQGLYHRQLSHFFDIFPDAQIKIFIFEQDVVERPDDMLFETTNFLGVEPRQSKGESKLRRNRSVTSRTALVANRRWPTLWPAWHLLDHMMPRSDRIRLPPEVVADLRTFYRDDVRCLENTLGRDLTHWLG